MLDLVDEGGHIAMHSCQISLTDTTPRYSGIYLSRTALGQEGIS